ncbi:hypothetical protein GCM10010399_49720 [Dactylosporangium fulvum]|uniref:Uncharacterized protein n=1 Tax=Dactylosporangium fulvum TaxID=53359 RepID=A0ABY5VTQ6_9ACTN|nr:hypothetical protein [Dactylosporangium fulvum]UWP81137.1 hypothetical protein Dfulv_39415 [Dactylosporangium fulvum]
MTHRDPREEAERLVATAFAALSVAADRAAGFATGSGECCACPVCKAIAAARNPDPDLAERVATGVGDIAVGLAGVLRSFGATARAESTSTSGRAESTGSARSAEASNSDEDDDVWRSATSET